MKLISNSSGSLFRYFPEIDTSKSDWSAANPHVCMGSSITIPAWQNAGNASPRYFAFKAVGGVEYTLSFNPANEMGSLVSVDVYDYVGYGLDDGEETGLVSSGVVGRYYVEEREMTVCTGSTRVLLAKVRPYIESIGMHYTVLYYSAGTDVKLEFSRRPEEFGTNAHYVRDWGNAIDGTCWNAVGKVYRHASLDAIGRRDTDDDAADDGTDEQVEG